MLSQATDPTTGLVPDWSAIGSSTCSEATSYVGYDAIRTHWRLATDYAWFEVGAAKEWLQRVTTYVGDEVGVDRLMDVQDGFFIDGSELLGDPGMANSAFLGAIAVGTLPFDQELSDQYHGVFLGVPSANDDSYYTVTARALSLLLSVNKFSPGCY